MAEPFLTPIPPMLYDMRLVYESAPEKGEHRTLVACRKMLDKTPRIFWERMAQLEREWLAGEKLAREHLIEEEKTKQMAMTTQGVPGPAAELPDEGTDRLLEIADQVLKGVGV